MIQWILYFYSRFIHFHDFIHVLVDFSFLWIFIYFPLASWEIAQLWIRDTTRVKGYNETVLNTSCLH